MEHSATLAQVRSIRQSNTRLLLVWSVASVMVGTLLFFLIRLDVWQTMNVHHVIWGAFDLIFALLGVRQYLKANRTPIDEQAIQLELKDRDNLIKSLEFNMKLNWLWVGSAAVLFIFYAIYNTNPSLLGHALGVGIQGGFLFWFDRQFRAQLLATQPIS